jgi:DNA polymerase, archaea type
MHYSENIIVENKKSLSGLLGYSDVYIGRPSLLGNPFHMGNESERLEVIRKFTQYAIGNESVIEEISKLSNRLKSGEKIRLVCFCSPKDCHGDVIRELVLSKISDGISTLTKNVGGLFNVACATGHRPNKLGGYDAESKQILFDYAVELLQKSNPDKVISGMALGWDFAIASAAIKLDIPLIAAVPFRDQPSKWLKDDVYSYYELLKKATEVVYVDAQEGYKNDAVTIGKYHPDKLSMRNKWMVDNSDYILAMWRPGETGGTKHCIDYAKQKYSLPKEQIIYLWDNYLEFRDNIGKPFVNEVIEGKSDVMVVDVLAEIESESTASYLSRSTEDDDEVTSEIADALLGMGSDGEIVYPYQLNPDMEFSPYNAVYNDGKRIHVDESYLAANLHWKPYFDYSSCEWEPRRVPDYRECKRVYLDIETLGLNPSAKEARGLNPSAKEARGLNLSAKEVRGLNLSAKEPRIIMIGIMIEGNYLGNSDIGKKAFDLLSKGHIIELQEDSDEAERAILTGLFRLIKALQPEAIVTHNGFDFDFPYIMKRCDILGIEHPMTRITDRERCITAASMYGQPIRFYPTYWTKPGRNGRIYNDGTFPQLVDTIHLAGQHDKIFANMTSYTLKYLAFYVGFRTEKRLELKGKEISIYWNSGEESKKQSIRDYLIFDLEDQRAVTNFFMVSPYYQTMYFPLPLQEIAVASPARKHNANLDNFYRKFYDRKLTLSDGSAKYYLRPVADEKVSYEGAIVDCKPGVYRYFFSLDVSSLYPSLMLTYALMTRNKDVLGVFLKTILTLRSLRYVYKDLGGSNPHRAKTRQAYQDFPYLFADIDFDNISKEDKKIFKGVDNSLKVGINGGYGFLGVGFYNFNDLESAALVTAYGRLIITKMRDVIESYSELIILDTDGIKASPKRLESLPNSLLQDKYFDNNGVEIPIDDGNGFVNPIWIWYAAQSVLPEGIVIDLEQNCPDGAVYAPAMKNYIFWEKPEDEPKLKGIYRKRNRSLLQKEFPIEFIRRWAFEGKTSAHKYGNEWITKISDFIVSNKNVLISETIQDLKKLKGDEKKHHKLLIESNCGEIGEEIVYYWGSRQHYAASGRKNGIKPFPIRRYLDGRVPNNQEFPCANEDVNKNVYIEKYVSDLETKVIPYSPDINLNEVMDLELVEKLMFTQRIPKQQFSKKTGEPQDNILVKNGMGEPGDTVSFYWASIQSYTASGKLSSKCDRFPVRVIINEDDSISINLQSIPDDIDKSLINLNFNVEWYLDDLLKIRNEILNVVDK